MSASRTEDAGPLALQVKLERDALCGGEIVRGVLTLIAEDAPVSVQLRRGAIVWRAVVRVEVPGKQRWEATHPITIHPPLRLE